MNECKIVLGFDDHDKVCRTASDTLAAEYNDYVTTKCVVPTSGHHCVSNCGLKDLKNKSCDNLNSDFNYISKVEFGLKLGYTESQVQMALVRIGPSVTQNELLEELIKLGASDPLIKGSNQTTSNCFSGMEPDETDIDNMVSTKICDKVDDCENLRPIVIDGSNVAMSHGNKEIFSCTGIKLCVDWFISKGHKEITVFVPMWRKEASRPDAPIKDREILLQLENERLLVFTPSRMVGGRKVVCYDDRYILKLASENDGIVVSNDNYRDLTNENLEYKKVVEERLLMYSFVNDRFMPPDDPLGRHGPSLENFLRKSKLESLESPLPLCSYGKKCTYGNKCKYFHPERNNNQVQKTVTERLAEQAKQHLLEVKARNSIVSLDSCKDSTLIEKPKATQTTSLPLSLSLMDSTKTGVKKLPLQRTKSGVAIFSNTGLDSKKETSTNQPFNTNLKSENITKTSSSKEQKEGVNLHRKLQRQLTLNSNNDSRLLHMTGYKEKSNNSNLPRTHKALVRIRSDGVKPGEYNPLGQFYLNVSNNHPTVTRISSAPCPDNSFSSLSSHQALPKKFPNSNSDSWLHINPNFITQFLTGPFSQKTVWNNEDNKNSFQFSPNDWSTNLTNLNSFRSIPVVAKTSCPQLKPLPLTVSPIYRSLSPELFSDNPRSKLYFHLAQIFPEKQVRAAMDLYPRETNAQCICAAILTMFPQT